MLKTICDLPKLTGESVIIMGSGPSLNNCPPATLRKHVTIAINDAGLYFQPTIHMIGDPPKCYDMRNDIDFETRYFVVQFEGMQQLMKANRWKVEPFPEDRMYTFRWALDGELASVTPDNDLLWYRETTSIGAMVLAWKLGATDIYLVGIDSHHLRFRPREGELRSAAYFRDPMFTHPEILQEPRECCWGTAIDRFVETWTPGRCNIWQTNMYASTKRVPYFPLGEL